ncbi:MAG: extracellular solute-binding protein [Bacteroidales bacterium]|nr:extracellular solute-binding protein [Bacteroidales bacterium]MCM1415929.1 extracellular solute-binding protein [bacterium]MCM1422651.1 extracellular solute-binding protein [bacterium]
MKKKLLSVLLAGAMVFSLTACGGNDSASTPAADNTQSSEPAAETPATDDSAAETPAADSGAADPTNGELVDGKFADTRKITVEVYNRENDGGSDPTNNKYTQYIKDQMLAQHNVEVEFVSVPRWTEVEQINNLLAAGDAPDICLTYDFATIQTYANMGGVLNLGSYVDDYKDVLPNMWNWLGETNIYCDKDPENGNLWAIEGKLAVTNRINTFVRKDWLDTLGLSEPTTRQEFEDMLIAFRDNADTLLGADADKMIPFSVSYDVGWRAALLIESFMDPDITDYEYYVNGFDDRKLTQNGAKEAIRVLNKWYNDGLMWDDFALYGSGDTTEDDMMKAGYVGAFMHNWDYPYRNGEDSIQTNLERLVSPDAAFVAVDCFEDSKGTHTKFVNGTTGDRKIFFPSTNDEPLASLLYLDFISSPEAIEYLQIGDEGVTHNKLDDGAIEIVAATGDDIQNSGFNIDYTITCNGLNLMDPEVTAKSTAHSYSGIDTALVEKANAIANTDAIPSKPVNVGEITSAEGQGEALAKKRDVLLDNAVVAPVESFDQVWDDAMADYMSSGGQAISDERAEKWKATFGDATMLP